MRLFTYIFVVCFSSVLFVSCIGCSNDNRTVTENNVYKKTTLWEKETVLRLKIDLSDGRSNYGYFQIEQEGRPIMALDFYSVPTNNGTSVVINARPREDLFTDWQRKKYNEDGNLCMFDDYDNEIGIIEDLSANELYDICIKIKLD